MRWNTSATNTGYNCLVWIPRGHKPVLAGAIAGVGLVPARMGRGLIEGKCAGRAGTLAIDPDHAQWPSTAAAE